MTIPDPIKYEDGLVFMRDMHKMILRNIAALSSLLDDAEKEGVFPSFATHEGWNGLFNFFTRIAPRHEMDEEEFIFPVLESRIPKMGFQQPDAPIRFLIEGHEVLQKKTMILIRAWEAFRLKQRDIASATQSAEAHASDDKEFVMVGRELVDLYHNHIATEEEKVYKVADKLFKDRDRELLIEQLRGVYDNEAITGPPQFSPPQFSDPKYNMRFVTDAVSGDAMDEEEEDDE